MPPIQEEIPYELSPPDSDLTPPIPSPTDYLSVASLEFVSETNAEAPSPSSVLYEVVEIPQEPTLKELIQRATGTDDISEVLEVKLKVITRDVSVQYLSNLTPHLRELILDGSVVSSLRDLGCGLKTLKVLRVNRCGLTSFDGMFGLQSLEELYASKNSIKDISPCSYLPKIKIIDVQRNILEEIDGLSFLILCPHLEHLYLEGNKNIEEFPKYRQTVRSLLPDLKTLDGTPLTEENGEASSSPSTSTKDGFLPPISKGSKRPESANKNSSYMVTFPPKLLSPRPTSSSSNDSSNNIQVKTLLPEISLSKNSMRKSGDSKSSNN